MKNTANLFLVALLSGIMTLGSYKLFLEGDKTTSENIIATAPTFTTKNVGLSSEAVDFTEAAESTLNQVVHVKNVSYRTVSNPIMEFMYGQRGGQQQQQIGTGSGVIISEDGYIVTNNHVINGAQDLEVTLNNKKTYKAKLIGTDSKMDIALLKVEADEKLPYERMCVGCRESIQPQLNGYGGNCFGESQKFRHQRHSVVHSNRCSSESG